MGGVQAEPDVPGRGGAPDGAGGSRSPRPTRAAQALLAAGQPGEALAALAKVPLENASPQPWVDRAEAHLALGEVREADYALAVARSSAPTIRSAARRPQPWQRLRWHWRAVTRRRQSQPLRASCGQWSGLAPYQRIVFRRLGLPGILLPPLDLLQRTDEDLAAYRRLAELYGAQGRAADAAWAAGRADALQQLLGTSDLSKGQGG